MILLKKILLFLLCLSSLALVVNFNEAPPSWEKASIIQILMLFIPLLFSLTFLLFIFLNSLTKSFAGALGLLIMIVLFASDQLNWFTALISLFLTLLAVYITPKTRLDPSSPKQSPTPRISRGERLTKPREDRQKLLKKL